MWKLLILQISCSELACFNCWEQQFIDLLNCIFCHPRKMGVWHSWQCPRRRHLWNQGPKWPMHRHVEKHTHPNLKLAECVYIKIKNICTLIMLVCLSPTSIKLRSDACQHQDPLLWPKGGLGIDAKDVFFQGRGVILLMEEILHQLVW